MADDTSFSSESSANSLPMSPATDLRHSWESFHYNERQREFDYPIRVKPTTHTYEVALKFYRSQTVLTKLLEDLEPDDYQRFCFRDCMMYQNSREADKLLLTSRLVDGVWREWFPRRDVDRDVADSNSFCDFARFWPSRTPEEICKFFFILLAHGTAQQPAIRRPEIPSYMTLGMWKMCHIA